MCCLACWPSAPLSMPCRRYVASAHPAPTALRPQVRRLMANRLDPSWSFPTLFLAKDGLAGAACAKLCWASRAASRAAICRHGHTCLPAPCYIHTALHNRTALHCACCLQPCWSLRACWRMLCGSTVNWRRLTWTRCRHVELGLVVTAWVRVGQGAGRTSSDGGGLSRLVAGKRRVACAVGLLVGSEPGACCLYSLGQVWHASTCW